MNDPDKIVVKKLEAAQSQLNTAINLWFNDADPVSIHTLAAAAYQIVHDIKVHRKIDRDLLYDARMVKDEYRADWIKVMKRAPNFFKHADRDPDADGSIEFSPFGNMVFMMVAAGGLQLCGASPSFETGALLLWLTIHEPRLIKSEYVKSFWDKAQKLTGTDDFKDIWLIPKDQFFEHYMRVSYARAEAGST